MYPCGGSLGKPTYTVEYKQLVEGSALVILSSLIQFYGSTMCGDDYSMRRQGLYCTDIFEQQLTSISHLCENTHVGAVYGRGAEKQYGGPR
jgi:hypothetical protein